jgi:sulfoxide reductase heme-binding subunit YedZ
MEKKTNTLLFYLAIISLYILVSILFILTAIRDSYDFFVRIFALLGFTSLFIASMMSPFMVQIYKYFGKKFINIHHFFSIIGLILITIHPVAFALSKMDITVFVPVFYPFYDFWLLAGRPALILIYIAVVAGTLRNKIPIYWKHIHVLNYVALFFGLIHGILIGTDFKNPAILILFSIMTICVFCGLIYKRYTIFKRNKKKRIN